MLFGAGQGKWHQGWSGYDWRWWETTCRGWWWAGSWWWGVGWAWGQCFQNLFTQHMSVCQLVLSTIPHYGGVRKTPTIKGGMEIRIPSGRSPFLVELIVNPLGVFHVAEKIYRLCFVSVIGTRNFLQNHSWCNN